MAKAAIDPQKAYAHLKETAQWALCDRCGWRWPEKMLREHSGRKFCPNHTNYHETTDEKTVRIQRQGARIARLREPLPKWPHPPEMRDVSGVSLLTPKVVTLTKGGANKALILTGRNLSALDTIAFSSSSVELALATTFTAINSETRGNTATLTVRAPIGGTNGNYDLLYNGDRFTQVFEVR